MTDHDVERALGYTPCVCGVIDGTWHSGCYRSRTAEQIKVDYKRAFANARKYLKQQAADVTNRAITRAVAGRATPAGGSEGAP